MTELTKYKVFIIVVPAKFGNESCTNTKKKSHSEPICSLLSNRIYLCNSYLLSTFWLNIFI